MKAIETRIGMIGNYYGGLVVKSENGSYFWAIENYDGCYWEDIPYSLYSALVGYNIALKDATEVNP